MNMCTVAMAGNATDHGMVPDHASWPAQQMAASTVAHHAAKAIAVTRPRIPPSQWQTIR